MEAENLRTCASCKHKKERVLRGHRVTAKAFCRILPVFMCQVKSCEHYAPRFAKAAIKSQMEVELL